MSTTTIQQGLDPTSAFDAAELARLARLCLGSTSTIQFSQRTGLSRSFLSALLNANLRSRPSRRSLEKMTSPNASPQNGITEAQLLKAAGYDSDCQISSSTPATPKASTFLEDVQRYCAADIDHMCVTAQYMVGELIKKGDSPKLIISVENGLVSISENPSNGEQHLLHICIPAFVPEDHLIPFAVSAATLQFGEARRRYKDCTARFHILTDCKSLCDFLSAAFSTEANLEISLINDISSGISTTH